MPASDTIRLLLADIDQELQTTRRLLERVPGDKLDWRPHPKSYTLGELATHIARMLMWGPMALELPGVDFATLPPGVGDLAKDRDSLLALFDEQAAAFRRALDSLLAGDTERSLGEPWPLTNAGHAIMTAPRALALRTFVVSHVVHHRGQLSVYLRLLDVPLPRIYGPTADER